MKRITIDPETCKVVDAYVFLINNDSRLSTIDVELIKRRIK